MKAFIHWLHKSSDNKAHKKQQVYIWLTFPFFSFILLRFLWRSSQETNWGIWIINRVKEYLASRIQRNSHSDVSKRKSQVDSLCSYKLKMRGMSLFQAIKAEKPNCQRIQTRMQSWNPDRSLYCEFFLNSIYPTDFSVFFAIEYDFN